jgi:hypothetical protein
LTRFTGLQCQPVRGVNPRGMPLFIHPEAFSVWTRFTG